MTLLWFAGRMLGSHLKAGLGRNSVECSVVGESCAQRGVRISNVFEVGEVE